MYKCMKTVDNYSKTIGKILAKLLPEGYEVQWIPLSQTAVGSIHVNIARELKPFPTKQTEITYVITEITYVIDVFRGGLGNQRYLRVMQMRKNFADRAVPVELRGPFNTAGELTAAIWEHDLEERIFTRALNKLGSATDDEPWTPGDD